MKNELVKYILAGLKRKIHRIFSLIEKNDEKYSERFDKIEAKMNGNGTPGFSVRLDRIEKTLEEKQLHKTWIIAIIASGSGAGMAALIVSLFAYFFLS